MSSLGARRVLHRRRLPRSRPRRPRRPLPETRRARRPPLNRPHPRRYHRLLRRRRTAPHQPHRRHRPMWRPSGLHRRLRPVRSSKAVRRRRRHTIRSVRPSASTLPRPHRHLRFRLRSRTPQCCAVARSAPGTLPQNPSSRPISNALLSQSRRRRSPGPYRRRRTERSRLSAPLLRASMYPHAPTRMVSLLPSPASARTRSSTALCRSVSPVRSWGPTRRSSLPSQARRSACRLSSW